MQSMPHPQPCWSTPATLPMPVGAFNFFTKQNCYTILGLLEPFLLFVANEKSWGMNIPGTAQPMFDGSGCINTPASSPLGAQKLRTRSLHRPLELLQLLVSSLVHVALASFPSLLLFLCFLGSLQNKLFVLKSLTHGCEGGTQMKTVASIGVWIQIPFL